MFAWVDRVDVLVEAAGLSAVTSALLPAELASPEAPVVVLGEVELVVVPLADDVLADELLVVVSPLEALLLDVAAVVEVSGCADLSVLPSSDVHAASTSGRAAVAASVAARVVNVRAEKMADTTTPGVGKVSTLC
ncbi:hypothetical protein QP888_07160 [Corynebacterium sp. MSK297]|uniref:hypothetical protein n=1 Tax=Corynebacterium sp. MSK297 TaxID=3050221 RepID=UPI00254AB7EA|nr:hypothetical protein [Corynebacterium sp. MSK297]MDK8846279.1 hypothetical protein [Corynebacterium sp. MSK297]